MEQIFNYRDIPTDQRLDILNALAQIGFFPAYGGVKTMPRIMEKSVPNSGPQFYFVLRENQLIGYNFLIAGHCIRLMEDYRKGIGKRKESDCR